MDAKIEQQIIDSKSYAASRLITDEDPKNKAYYAGQYIALEGIARSIFGTSNRDYIDAVNWAKNEAKLN